MGILGVLCNIGIEEEHNHALVSKMRKCRKKGLGKGPKGKNEDSSFSNQGKRDLSYIKCFKC